MRAEKHKYAISKALSANDTGETGGHQAGILIPKKDSILSFFPTLTKETKNPRSKLKFIDCEGKEWFFTFIYYNNRFYEGTRNEFRLTGMTSFIRKYDLKAGDTIILTCDDENNMFISHERKTIVSSPPSTILKLGSSWKVVKI
ncbi:EcoRII N-terminal effector-binding domain-containing protein [Sutcliffiella horikoshii]|uniref:EcoRII N-terminal effector-binding domain-containing protein n=1 Tax=Sutcliffiella horikoshii TaxID=79883 RepID=UPI003CEC311F